MTSSATARPRYAAPRPAIRLGLALVGMVMAGLLALAGPASAQGTIRVPAGRGAALPSAPSSAASASILAVSPTITPAARRVRHAATIGGYDCPSGNLCVAVWDPTTSDYKVFDLFACNLYALHNWHSVGSDRDNQTGNVLSTYYDQNQSPLISFRPNGGELFIVDSWEPVWFIRNC